MLDFFLMAVLFEQIFQLQINFYANKKITDYYLGR